MDEDDLVKVLDKYIHKSSASDVLESLPENAYNFERASHSVNELANGFVPFLRHFSELPLVNVYLVVKFSDELDQSTTITNPEYENNNTNITQYSPLLSKHKRSESINKDTEDKETYCYKFYPIAYTVSTLGITINQIQLFSIDSSAQIQYIAYNKFKPIDSHLKKLNLKLMMGDQVSEQDLSAWISSGSLISTTNTDEQSLLHIACEHSQYTVAKMLVEKKIDIEKSDKNGWTPLFCAVSAKDIRLAQYLIERGGLTHPVYTTNGSTIFHYLVRIVPKEENISNYTKILEAASAVYKENTCQSNFSLETPFQRAAGAGNLQAVKWLLDPSRPFTFDPNSFNKNGENVLHYAVKSGNTEMVRYLIQQNQIDVPSRDSPQSPYQLALSNRLIDIANLFPFSAKAKFSDLPVFILMHIFKRLEIIYTTKISMVNKHHQKIIQAMVDQNLLKSPKNLRTKSELMLWGDVEKSEILFQRDIKHISSAGFRAGWNRYDNVDVTGTDHYGMNILIVGNSEVGTSTFLDIVMNTPGKFTASRGQPVQEFAIKNVDLNNGSFCEIRLWEKRLEDRYRTNIQYRGASTVIVMYDSTDENSIELMVYRAKELYRKASMYTAWIFVGTKTDKAEKKIDRDDLLLALKKHCPRCGFADEDQAWPVVMEIRKDNPESMLKAFQLAAYYGSQATQKIRLQPRTTNNPPVQKRSIVSSFKKLFKS